MPRCCNARGCDGFFTLRFARRAAKRYRERGLDKTARRMVGFLETGALEGATVLEIGGGVGEIQIELLKRGASRAINLELSPAYAEEAARLLREEGLEDRAGQRLHDIAAEPESVEAADIVVLHRVVCCYPDYERLLGAAAQHARRFVVFSYPRRNAISRLFVRAQNLVFRLLRKEFRTFAHPPSAMLAVLAENGFRRSFAHAALIWQVAGLERERPIVAEIRAPADSVALAGRDAPEASEAASLAYGCRAPDLEQALDRLRRKLAFLRLPVSY